MSKLRQVLTMGIFNPVASGGDTTRPTCTITCDASSPSAAATFNYTITFSEVVTGFEVGDFGITGGSKGALGGSGAVYTCAVTPAGNAPVVATVAEGVAADGAGNTNTAATPLSIGVQVTLTYQPDNATGQDCNVNSSSADTNNGGTGSVRAATNTTILIKFPIAALGAGATVAGTLSLWVSTQLANNKTLNVYRILAANNGWDELTSTWNYKTPSTARWAGDAAGDGGADAGCSVAGTDYSSTIMSSASYTANAPVGTQLDFSLNAAELALLCANNYGFAIRETQGTQQLILGSCENATPAYYPKLVVVVTYPP